jgi:hypothetical protein
MTNKPYCPRGKRRCSVSKLCISNKKGSRTKSCPKGTRKCANSKCYKRHKSVGTRRKFTAKYGR